MAGGGTLPLHHFSIASERIIGRHSNALILVGMERNTGDNTAM